MRATCVHRFPTLSSSTSHFVVVGISPPWKPATSTHWGSLPLTFPKRPLSKFCQHTTVGCIYKLYLFLVTSTRTLILSLIFILVLIATVFCSSPSLDFSATFSSEFLLSGRSFCPRKTVRPYSFSLPFSFNTTCKLLVMSVCLLFLSCGESHQTRCKIESQGRFQKKTYMHWVSIPPHPYLGRVLSLSSSVFTFTSKLFCKMLQITSLLCSCLAISVILTCVPSAN